MARIVVIGLIGFALAVSAAQAGDTKDEVDFVTRASIGNLVTIAESRLALDRSTDAGIKAFAQHLVKDHGIAETALQAAADGSGAAVPTALDPDHLARLTSLQGKSGPDFDKAYVADQVEVHSNALTLYADYMLLGSNGTLKALAIKMIPIAEAQFKAAQALSGR
ncbi:DUF4142 domain-containing protein [Lichenifustis flavocetrariae]|uniref:DUF4142 domain-containing protein n=1 Tax=Lichenifustis flavocetrariae TaxID=2949735 RepID=A0AA41Z1Y2_9HYPH|nr:DUF4142 domain-containing protein [Lichenifustis flavocetrariae]MCW6507782.1 DUF4142 domain-containing protein [Lichenifustis flavocetrariae]